MTYYEVEDSDHFDGCELDLDDNSKNTRDDEIAALVLFADVDFTDPAVVEARKQEWEALL